jgi:protocatechuate 3,4-dioxygenase beta subunit
VGLLKKLAQWRRGSEGPAATTPKQAHGLRICRFEPMEPRRMLAADLHFGAVYFEEATGDDSQPDVIEVTFEGGAAGTQLTELTISGDKHGDGALTIGDVFFDTQAGGLGAFRSVGLTIEDHAGFDILGFSVADGTSDITFFFEGFDAGEKLVFSIDVDEVSFIDNAGAISATSVVEGGEFERSILTGVFEAEHFYDETLQATFWDAYDGNFAAVSAQTGLVLDLPDDAYSDTHDFTDRTAGAVARAEQEFIPASISGYVYHDRNDDGVRDPGEEGIEGVDIEVVTISAVDGSLNIYDVETDEFGYYEVTGLAPGEYLVLELEQPDPYLDGKDTPGSHGGEAADPDADELFNIFLAGGDDGVEYNFGEVLPGSIRGRVHADPEGDCEVGPEDILLEGVRIDLLDAQGNLIDFTFTDDEGRYAFEDLAPGEYQVFEHQPTEYFDGDDHVGAAGGIWDGDDTLSNIVLTSGLNAQEYDFCEYPGVSISGYVYHDRSNEGSRDPGEEGIGGVTLKLLDENGDAVLDEFGVAVTTTTSLDPNNLGYYEFTNLPAGKYGVMEVHPDGWLDGTDTPGSHGGTADNPAPGDMITGAMLSYGEHGVEYNFGELQPSSISGRVHASTDGDCIVDPSDILLEGVQIDLLDDNGGVIATTFTDDQGFYTFEDLGPGTYKVFEHQPAYYDGDDHVGSAGGVLEANDRIGGIVLTSGTQAVEYDFCEHVGVNLSGYVYHDRSNEGSRDPGEEGIGGVTLKLLDAAGNVILDGGVEVATTTSTDPTNLGYYEFTNLPAGVYGVLEIHPPVWLDGIDTPGNRGGTADPSPPGDRLMGAVLQFGLDGVEYNFGELLPGKIHGTVYVDTDQDCIHDPDEQALEGVVVELLDDQGNVIDTTETNAEGEYWFMGLRPGTYSVRQQQPDGFFEGGEMLGSGGGIYIGPNHMGGLSISSGDELVQYDFKEIPPASISGYVFQDGATLVTEDGNLPTNLSALRDGQLTGDDTRLPGVVLELRHGVTGEPILASEVLPGVYASGPVRTTTNGSGFYEFVGLPPGIYAVYEVQPADLHDWLDTEGSTGGFTFNVTDPVDPFVLFQLGANDPQNDAIVRIIVGAGESSVLNNFSEVAVRPEDIPPTPIPPMRVPPPEPPPFVPVSPTFPVFLPESPTPQVFLRPGIPWGGSSAVGYTWHLSVVDAGKPRSMQEQDLLVHLTSTELSSAAWEDVDMHLSSWSRTTSEGEQQPDLIFGSPYALPVAGDFNGDGVSEVGVYLKGHWFIDVNGNGRWDDGDLWAKLGTDGDLPAVGDWDGDGKTDIGIYGPAWPGDPRAIAEEPGLPDESNEHMHKRKNFPPRLHEATHGSRVMKLTSRGQARQDVIDHVFHYGTAGDVPITGDWNGDGIDTIGVFRKGAWHIDVDGDGRLSDKDAAFQYGMAGDLPVIGDFDGDGVDEIGVYRAGQWFVDKDGDRDLTAHDEAFQLGGGGDLPVVGDWDGDGVDDPAVYHLHAPPPGRATH